MRSGLGVGLSASTLRTVLQLSSEFATPEHLATLQASPLKTSGNAWS